jgi:hypothetical protein
LRCGQTDGDITHRCAALALTLAIVGRSRTLRMTSPRSVVLKLSHCGMLSVGSPNTLGLPLSHGYCQQSTNFDFTSHTVSFDVKSATAPLSVVTTLSPAAMASATPSPNLMSKKMRNGDDEDNMSWLWQLWFWWLGIGGDGGGSCGGDGLVVVVVVVVAMVVVVVVVAKRSLG